MARFAILGQQERSARQASSVAGDKLDESEWESIGQDGDGRSRCRVLQVITLCLVTAVIMLAVLVISLNLIAKSAIEAIGSYSLGVDTRVGSVALSAFSSLSSVREIVITSPEIFGEVKDLLRLRGTVFDLGFWPALGHSVFNLRSPFKLQEIRVRGVHVLVSQELDGTSNAGIVLHHMLEAGNESGRPRPNTRAMNTRIIVDRVTLEDIEATVRVMPIAEATGPRTFHLKEVRLEEVGKKANGITLADLLKAVVRAILGAVINRVDGDIQVKLLTGLGGMVNSIENNPHVKEIQYDAGQGLTKFHHWADKAMGGLLSNVSSQVSHVMPQMPPLKGILGSLRGIFGSHGEGGKDGAAVRAAG